MWADSSLCQKHCAERRALFLFFIRFEYLYTVLKKVGIQPGIVRYHDCLALCEKRLVKSDLQDQEVNTVGALKSSGVAKGGAGGPGGTFMEAALWAML